MKYSINDVKFIEKKRKKLAYSEHGKKIVSENKGLLKAFLEMDKKKLSKYVDPHNKFIITKLKASNKGSNICESYKIHIKDKNRIYFIKEINKHENLSQIRSFQEKINSLLDGYHEMKAITILKDLGIDVIKAHFSYLNPKSQKAYIAYDFTNLKTVKELVKEKKISKSEINRIENKIREFKVKVNLSLLKDFEKYHTIAYINAELNKIRRSYSSTIIADIEKYNIF